MNFILFITGAFLLVAACINVFRYTESGYMRPLFALYVSLKIMGGLTVGLVFFHYYGFGDTITYFEEAGFLYQRLMSGNLSFPEFIQGTDVLPYPGQPRAQFMLKVVTVLYFFALGNYYLITTYIAVVTALASWKFADTLTQVYHSRLAVLVAILFLPLVLFWGSGILKESFALAAIYMIANYVLRIVKLKEGRLSHYAWIVFASIVLLKLKYYFAAILLPLTVVLLLMYHLDRIYQIRRRFLVPIMFLLLFVGIGVASKMHPNLDLAQMPKVIYQNHEAFLNISREDNIIRFKNLEPTWQSLFSNAPLALLSGLYRPFPSERGNGFKRVIGLGNVLLLFLTVTALRQKWPRDKMTTLLLLASIIYIVAEAIFLSLSTPNFGTLSRFKIGFMPLMVYLVLVNNPIQYWLNRNLKIIKWINR